MLRVDSVREVAHIIITVMGSGAHTCSRRFAFMSQLPPCTTAHIDELVGCLANATQRWLSPRMYSRLLLCCTAELATFPPS